MHVVFSAPLWTNFWVETKPNQLRHSLQGPDKSDQGKHLITYKDIVISPKPEVVCTMCTILFNKIQ